MSDDAAAPPAAAAAAPLSVASLSIDEILAKCEKDGEVSDYGASKPDGKNILKYVLEYEGGYYYLFKNNSSELHLDTDLDFEMTNLLIVSFDPSTTKVRISLPPHSTQHVHIARIDPALGCNCEITQRFALVQPKDTKLSSVTAPLTYTIATPLDELQTLTETQGLKSAHGSQDPAGLLVYQYQWEYSGGYCFLWVNATENIHFHKELELDLKNLEISGAQLGEDGSPAKKYTVDLVPGQKQFMVLKEVAKKQAYGLSIRAEFSLDKIGGAAPPAAAAGDVPADAAAAPPAEAAPAEVAPAA